MITKKCKISIIVPVYNTSLYVETCIKSLLSQSYDDFELIIVDDGSTDNSYEICVKQAEEDRRVKVYRKKNGGLSDARNYGITKATGEYLMFLDSDDWFEIDMLEQFNKVLEKQACDVIMQGFIVELVADGISYHENFEKEYIYTKDLYNAVILAEKAGLFNSSCNKLYRKEIIDKNHLSFSVGKEPAEDLIFNCEVFSCVNSIYALQYSGYHYIKRQTESLTVKYMPNYEKRILDFYQVRKTLYESIGMPKEEAEILLTNSLASYALTALSNLYRKSSPLNYKQRRHAISYIYSKKQITDAVLNSKYSNLFLKIFRCMIRTKNVSFSNMSFTVLYGARYKLEGLYFKVRKRILYSNGK